MSQNKKGRIAVILLNWNTCDDTIECINSLKNGSISPELIIVVDNNSSDDSVEILRSKFKDIIVLANDQNLGFAEGNNVGINYAIHLGYDFLWILNNDTIIDSNCLEYLRDSYCSYDELTAMTCSIYHYDKPDKLWYGGGQLRRMSFSASQNTSNIDCPSANVDFVSGCCIFASVELFNTIGTFDANFFAYHEDLDLSLRIKKHGGKLIFLKKASILHKVSSSFNKTRHSETKGTSSPFVIYLTVRNKFYIIRKHSENAIHFSYAFTLHLLKSFFYAAILLLLRRLDKFTSICAGIRDGITKKI